MKFNTKKPSTKTRNLAGGQAFRMSNAMELVHAVLATFLEDKFYESGDARISRIAQLVEKNEPMFVSNLATVARQEFHLRSVVTVLIAELAKTHRGDSLVCETIVRTVQRVDDLIELVAYFKRDKKALPKQVKRGIRNALYKFNRYQLAKYRAEGRDVTLVDVFNLVHPKPQHASTEQKRAWKDLMEGRLVSFDTWETEISNAKDDKARTRAWEKLIAFEQLGYMALIRNLNNLVKYQVSTETLKLAAQRIANPEQVKRSKQLPFRFYTAYQNVKGSRLLSDAISEAMDHAVANTPVLEGKTLVAVDCSGSMDGDPIQKAAIFGATLVRANKDADLILYDDKIKEISLSSRMPVVNLAEDIMQQATGGGTDTSLVFSYIVNKRKYYDRVIIISDNESWKGCGNRLHVQEAYKEYKKMSGQDPFVYAIDIAGYGTSDVAGGRVIHLVGWSNRLLDFIGQAERGETLVDYISEYIPMVERKIPFVEDGDETVDN